MSLVKVNNTSDTDLSQSRENRDVSGGEWRRRGWGDLVSLPGPVWCHHVTHTVSLLLAGDSYREGGEGETDSSEAVEGERQEDERRQHWRERGREGGKELYCPHIRRIINPFSSRDVI